MYTSLPDSNLYFEYTGIFIGMEWNTYRAVIHIQCKLDKLDVFEKYREKILKEASALFAK